MIEECEAPFIGYKVYKIFHKKEGRYYAVLVPIDKNSGLKKFTTSWARYLMSVHLGRILCRKSEHVDHINNIRTDDRLENLQILTPRANSQKSAKPQTFIELRCLNCKSKFFRRKGNEGEVKGYKNSFCTRKCMYDSQACQPPLNKNKPLRHGTKVAYSYHKCRCNECKEFNKIAAKSYRLKKAESSAD